MTNILRAVTGLMFLLAGSAGAASWQVEVVDGTGPGKYSSLKIDKDGNAHVAYVIEDRDRYPLKYGFWDHALKRWFIMKVAEGASFCSLALDSKQQPHISYADFGTGSGSKLHYASWSGKTWTQKAIPLNSDVIGYYTSLVLDAQDQPRISFYEYRGPVGTEVRIRLREVMWNGKIWQVRTVDEQEGSGKFNAMAIDMQGHVHLAYANVSATTAGMRYAYWDGTVWKPEIIDGQEQNNGESVGYSANIALDKDGDPHLTYMNESKPIVKYAVRKAGKWQIQVVDRISAAGYPDRNSIALDENGTPYIGYYDAGRGELVVAHREGDKWAAEIVDGNASGFTSSIQIDRENIWVSYADDANGTLKVARREIGAHVTAFGPVFPGSSQGKSEGGAK